MDGEGDEAYEWLDVTELRTIGDDSQEDITKKVAEAPKVRTDRVQSLRELEEEIPQLHVSRVGLQVVGVGRDKQRRITEI